MGDRQDYEFKTGSTRHKVNVISAHAPNVECDMAERGVLGDDGIHSELGFQGNLEDEDVMRRDSFALEILKISRYLVLPIAWKWQS